ncbi:Sialic acid-specific 9-O-acetylesterase [Rhodopirellula islandica]|uniref:Sialic acid-specific 9-O-acetylesterase n=1 Tax=Rhodopirellula islandica TaxID=595434 RepID=A0A0J1BEE6_RHOIS|nr:sialate O-acetylesterase [Rhodopirellula islandica]KLU04948.1 Sialic acid-specific 9-O-acetylesterase [Rhodopirellula islandica]
MKTPLPNRFLLAGIAIASCLTSLMGSTAQAELMMPAIFGDSMVVQRNEPVHIWGWTKPGQEVSVQLGDRAAKGKANDEGRFDVSVPALPAGGPYDLTVKADETKTFTDVLVGEVWICSGQSNMAWAVQSANDGDLESLTANYPQIRLISVPTVGTQEPQRDFKGSWTAATPETVKGFSAVGYFFGRQLHETLDVPVGLIDNAWGGSAAEAWVPRDVLEAEDKYESLLAGWDKRMKNYDYDALLKSWKEKNDKWVADGRQGNAPRRPRDDSAGNQRPANIYNGVLLPTIGYTIRGAIWYQGESNAGRAYEYRDLFPLMIQTWRDKWGQGDFPFYWVQLADFRSEVEEPTDSSWAELREAQTMTMSRLPNTGEAVILNLGESADIHPKNKQDVAKRLARWALVKDYGYDIPYRSPTYREVKFDGNKAIVKFDHVGGGLDTFDVRELIGFTIAGEDQKFVHAQAKIVGKDTIEVSADSVETPVSVRYAWADNPVCNVQSLEGLPVTPFRTDDWPGITQPKK